MIYKVTNQRKARKFLKEKTNFPKEDIPPKGYKINSIELDHYIGTSDMFGVPLSKKDVLKTTFGLKLEVDFDVLPSVKRPKKVPCTMFGKDAEAELDKEGKIVITTKD